MFAPGFTNREGEPLPLIVRKQDGGYGYAATDLAALRYRTQTLRGTRLLYVVGAPQAQHFAMVFAAGELAGWLEAARARGARRVRLGARRRQEDAQDARWRYGAARGVARRGDRARRRGARAPRSGRATAAARRALAPQIGIGAIKYADLANDRIKDYVFDWDRMLAAEGRTGPYLQYAHARIHSIFRKAPESGVGRATAQARRAGRARRNARSRSSCSASAPRCVEAAETLRPHRLCGYLYELATAFTAFFESVPGAARAGRRRRATRASRCAALTARVLARGLDLLGIEAPERM